MPPRSPERARAPRQAGFTLLEVIIALSLSALVALLGALLVRTATDYYARGNAFLDQQEQMRQVLRLFDIVGPALAAEGAQFVGQPDRLEFTTDRLPLGLNLPGKQRVRLQCEPDGQLMLRIIDPLSIGQPGEPKEKRAEAYLAIETLGSGLQECAFGYLRAVTEKTENDSGRWEEAWLPDFGGTPKAVRLVLATPQYRAPPFVIAIAP